MENKNSSKRNATLDNFTISIKRARDENHSLNFTSNQSRSSLTLSLSIKTNTLTVSSPTDHSSTDVCTTNSTNSSSNTENSPSKSSSKASPSDVSQTSQDASCQSHLIAYLADKEKRSFQSKLVY